MQKSVGICEPALLQTRRYLPVGQILGIRNLSSQRRRTLMSLSKRTFMIAAAGATVGLSTAAMAQGKTGAMAQGKSKSRNVTQLGEGDAVWLNPKTGNLQKSNAKISAAKHQAVLAGGGKEISRGAVIYKQGGKMYMFDPAAANEAASSNFQDQFDDWANQ